MIGTIRKHTAWLWWLIAGGTIISFVFFMGMGPARSRNGGGGQDYGLLYGRPITPEQFGSAQREFLLYYWFRNHEWPDKASGVTSAQIEISSYQRMALVRKAADLGIRVSDDAVASEAAQMMRMLGRGQMVPMDQFDQRILAPEHLTLTDFQNFVRTDLTIQQLVQAMGMSGTFVTPQEAGELYDRENQEVSAQAVFFSASNHLAQATVTPARVGEFFTNNMAYYREPDRVQISYVKFNVTNFLAQAKAEWAKTNFNEVIDAQYRQYGAEFTNDTPESAKAKLREMLIRQRALSDADLKARDFVTPLFAMDPVNPQNIAVVAKQQGMAVSMTEPFSETTGPLDFDAPPALTTAAFQLTADSPFNGPITAPDGIYVIALAAQLPSAIPPLESIQAQVTRDLQMQEAAELARRAGTNFYFSVAIKMATGKTFAQAVTAGGQTPEMLPPFSLSSSEVPGFETRTEIGELKRAAFTTTPGHISPFMPTQDGGFVLYVQSLLPVDEMKKASELPSYLGQLRQARENEAFNLWLSTELNKQLSQSPYFQQLAKQR
jgi:hypothetical protein